MCSIGAAIGIIGGVVSGVGNMMQMQAQAQSHENQAALMELQAGQEYQAGAYRATRLMDNAARVGGQQRAATAEGGLDPTGSAGDVMMDTASEADLDIAAVLWNSDAQVSNLNFGASIEKDNAASARAAMPFAFLSPVLGAATRII